MKIYCCGVFDLPHYGHFEFFEKIANFHLTDSQNDVIVGVHGDEVCKSYKRIPFLTMEQRCHTLSFVKNVTKIIKDVPLVTTMDFLEKNDIDLVAIPKEYIDDDGNEHGENKYYTEIIEAKKYIIIPRCNNISTSLILNKLCS